MLRDVSLVPEVRGLPLPRAGYRVVTSMSASLLRKGLELLEKDVCLAKKGMTSVVEPVGTKKAVTRRRMQKGGRQQNMATVKGKMVKSAIEEYRKQHGADNLQRNLQYMRRAKVVVDCAVTKQVLDQNRGRKALDRKPEKAKKKAVTSVFTDEDFKRFEREYFGGGSGKV